MAKPGNDGAAGETPDFASLNPGYMLRGGCGLWAGSVS
jgi:hypothetical protein